MTLEELDKDINKKIAENICTDIFHSFSHAVLYITEHNCA